mgnify:CR=1 FL=1
MANLTREEIIKRGYVTDPFVVNSNVDVDSELFKAAITDRFYYDLIYRGDGEKSQVKSALKEKVIEIQEPVTIVEEVVEPQEVVKTSTESVLLEEDLKEEIKEPKEEVKEEVIETPVEPEKKSKKSTKKVEEVDPVEPVVEETKE